VFYIYIYRDSVTAQLELALSKADSEQLARSIAEEQLSDLEKQKTVLELEIKELMSRQKSDSGKKENQITMVMWCISSILLNKENEFK